MSDFQLYSLLLQFPLFQGLSRADLLNMAGYTRFDFMRLDQGKYLAREGSQCGHLYFLIRGSLDATTAASDHSFRVVERLSAPWLVQPEALFGYNQHFTSTFRAAEKCQFISIEKGEVMRMLDDFLVFRLNFLGMLATSAQRQGARQWRRSPEPVADRVKLFFANHCIYPAGAKTFHILMNDIARELNSSRYHISAALNEMQQQGLLTLHRGRIEIPHLEHLFM